MAFFINERIYYSHWLAAAFGELFKGLQQLVSKKPFTIAERVDRFRCRTCGRLLDAPGKSCIYCISKKRIAQRILGYLKPHKRKVLCLFGITLGATAAQLVPPHLTRWLLDNILTFKKGDLLPKVIGSLLATAFLTMLLNVANAILANWLGARITNNIRKDLFHHIQRLSLKFYDRFNVGSIMSRVLNDSDRIHGFLIEAVPYILSQFAILIGVTVILFYYDWRLALYTFIPVPVLLIGGVLFMKNMQRLWRQAWRKWSALSGHLNEVLSGIRVIKAFTREKIEDEKFNARVEGVFAAEFRANRQWMGFSPTMVFVMTSGSILTWYVGSQRVLQNQLSIGTLVAFQSYLWTFYGPLQWVSNVNYYLSLALVGAERIFEMLDFKPEEDATAKQSAPALLRGEIELRDVHFGYEIGKPVLEGIDFKIRPGELVGLVGKSGSGKTTLINLVMRFYEAQSGQVLIDGKDIKKIKLDFLRDQIGAVLQEPFLFEGSIADNIAFAKPGAGADDIIAAARAARAHDFIVEKPDGYNTLLGERGTKLSVGEKQRISIARAILRDPRILILDEATSSLDTETEEKIQEAIHHLVKNRTTLAIAHRLSTLRKADRLIVLEDGKIAETGTHVELVEKKGIYFSLLNKQKETAALKGVDG